MMMQLPLFWTVAASSPAAIKDPNIGFQINNRFVLEVGEAEQ